MMKANSDVTKGYIKNATFGAVQKHYGNDNVAFNGEGFTVFRVSSEVLARQKQLYSTFVLFNSAQKALHSCLSHVPLLRTLRPSGPS